MLVLASDEIDASSTMLAQFVILSVVLDNDAPVSDTILIMFVWVARPQKSLKTFSYAIMNYAAKKIPKPEKCWAKAVPETSKP